MLGIFGDAFVGVVKSPFVFLGDAQNAFTGENGGAGAFLDTHLPVRPAYRLYRAEYMLRQHGCDALADLYAQAADELTQQVALVGVGGLTGWRRQALEPETSALGAEGLKWSPHHYGDPDGHKAKELSRCCNRWRTSFRYIWRVTEGNPWKYRENPRTDRRTAAGEILGKI
ncbi:hypothetical protein ACWD04_23770 [Streptomyces sp. NPDC002911]